MSVSNNPFVRTSRFRKTQPTTSFDTGSLSAYGFEQTLNAIPPNTPAEREAATRILQGHPDLLAVLGLNTASPVLEKA